MVSTAGRGVVDAATADKAQAHLNLQAADKATTPFVSGVLHGWYIMVMIRVVVAGVVVVAVLAVRSRCVGDGSAVVWCWW
jgi:hypothetical protein